MWAQLLVGSSERGRSRIQSISLHRIMTRGDSHHHRSCSWWDLDKDISLTSRMTFLWHVYSWHMIVRWNLTDCIHCSNMVCRICRRRSIKCTRRKCVHIWLLTIRADSDMVLLVAAARTRSLKGARRTLSSQIIVSRVFCLKGR